MLQGILPGHAALGEGNVKDIRFSITVVIRFSITVVTHRP